MDVVCLSHLRWDFVYQRPQHLLGRCARERQVLFVEEPRFEKGPPRLEVSQREDRLCVVVPCLPEGLGELDIEAAQRELLDELLAQRDIERYLLWYYTPMALGFTRHLVPLGVVYDCMDELSAFAGAPPALRELEPELLARADLVFTGGPSLFEAKRQRHPSVHLFPSSVDLAHFAGARSVTREPTDQETIARPRLGFFGVIDERMDLELLESLAEERPEWQLVLVGPVAKIDPTSLPRRTNIHYLGPKSYADLPAYLGGWDVTLMPFARNESTRFISPTKTPEYLAAGKPVVSTPIRDVVRPYGELGLVRIAETAAEFVAAVEASLADDGGSHQRRAEIFLSEMSWDRTWQQMQALIEAHVTGRNVQAAAVGMAAAVPASR
jgi:glycosyltransferase involved in cell wall biosynthesis